MYVYVDIEYKTLHPFQTLFWNIPMSNINLIWLYPIHRELMEENQGEYSLPPGKSKRSEEESKNCSQNIWFNFPPLSVFWRTKVF